MLNLKYQLHGKNNLIIKKNRNRFLITARSLNKKILHQIHQCSINEGISPNLLFSIIVIEKMNRGHFLIHILECILSIISPSLVYKMDLSLGLGQVKISTAKEVCNLPSNKLLVRKLVNPLFNIKVVSKLLKHYSEKVRGNSEEIKLVINLYTTGKQHPKLNNELFIYYDIVFWSIRIGAFNKFY